MSARPSGGAGARAAPTGLGSLGALDGRPAVVEPSRGAIAYAALDRLAARVAARLQSIGIEPGARIGLYLTRSSDAIAAILGVLRAGCAYVPVDPGAPAERNADIHAACGVAATLVEERFARAYGDALRRRRPEARVEVLGPVGLGRAVAEWAREGRGNGEAGSPPLRSGLPPHPEIACVLYTSASTGPHKGWLMSRAAIEAHARWCHDLIRPGRDDAFANHAQFSFGMSLFDIFSSLSIGARLVLVPEEVRPLARPIVELLAEEKVTVWFSGPAILSRIAELPDLERHDLHSLRVLAFAGETFPAAQLALLRRRLPHPRTFNFYGSTETNVAAFFELPANATVDGPVPIGRPCAHYEARLVEPEPEPDRDRGRRGRVVPVGAVGELQLRGVGLTTGYLGQPALTTERLVEAADGGGPWYRTCDLAVELPTGDLRYVGRLGRMVKIRGYSVEPGEIEVRLREHPGVAEAAVVPVVGPRGPVLVAHLGSPRIPVVALKEFCAAKLPPYMVPERFVFHDSLPRNLRGKIDVDGLRSDGAGSAEDVEP